MLKIFKFITDVMATDGFETTKIFILLCLLISQGKYYRERLIGVLLLIIK